MLLFLGLNVVLHLFCVDLMCKFCCVVLNFLCYDTIRLLSFVFLTPLLFLVYKGECIIRKHHSTIVRVSWCLEYLHSPRTKPSRLPIATSGYLYNHVYMVVAFPRALLNIAIYEWCLLVWSKMLRPFRRPRQSWLVLMILFFVLKFLILWLPMISRDIILCDLFFHVYVLYSCVRFSDFGRLLWHTLHFD